MLQKVKGKKHVQFLQESSIRFTAEQKKTFKPNLNLQMSAVPG